MGQPLSADSKFTLRLILGIMMFLVGTDIRVVSLALPAIGYYFHSDTYDLAWVMNAFLLASTGTFIVSGRMTDVYGEYRIFLYGTFIFTVASLLCALSINILMLYLARAMQGIGFAMLLSSTPVIISRIYPQEKRGHGVGVTIVSATLGMVLGPLIAGFILQYANWRWIFMINIPIGVIAMILNYRHISTLPPRKQKEYIDYVGALLQVISISLIVYALNEFDWELFIAASLIFILYLFKEHEAKNPTFDIELLRIPRYAAILLIRVVIGLQLSAIMFYFPLFLINIAQHSPLQSAFVVMIMTTCLGTSSMIGGKLLDRHGPELFVKISLFFASIGFAILLFISKDAYLMLSLLGLAFVGLGLGLGLVSTTTEAINILPKKRRGMGMGAFFMFAFMGRALGVAISSSILITTSSKRLAQMLTKLGIDINSITIMPLLKKIASGAHSISAVANHITQPDLGIYHTLTINSFLAALRSINRFCLIITLIGFGMSLILFRSKARIKQPEE